MSKKAVIAIGGNSLIRDNQVDIPQQMAAARDTCKHIAGLIEAGYDVVITHGNGPQVGFMLLRSELARPTVHPVPLDTLGADTQGAIGYWLQQALTNEFKLRRINRTAATVITQVVVDRDDPAFQHPTKPIGPFYSKEDAERRMREDGWIMVEDAGRGWRRVVPSPQPREIVELPAIRHLVENGFIVVGVGGGGIPVIWNDRGELEGVAAVIDKDRASALLAVGMEADVMIISTAVEKVALNYRKPNQVDLDHMTLDEAKRYLAEGHFAAGSMGPKVEAAIYFLERGGKEVIITDPDHLELAVHSKAGTHITPS
jgi:carbamate kinase